MGTQILDLDIDPAPVDTDYIETQKAGGQSYRISLATVQAGIDVPPTQAYTDDAVLGLGDIGKECTNEGAAKIVTLTLPDAEVAREFSFIRLAEYDLRIQPAAGDTIGLGDADKYLAMQASYTRVHLRCHVANFWTILSETGINVYQP